MILISAITLVSVLSAVSASYAKDGELKKDLRLNMRDKEVVTLQSQLKNQGLLSTPATGFFGAKTEKAVKDFQKANGLPQTGVVDQATRGKLIPAVAASGKAEVKTGSSLSAGPGSGMDTAKQIKMLTDMVNQLKAEIAKMQEALVKMGAMTQPAAPIEQPTAPVEKVDPAAQAAAGIIIHGGVSGPGYPTGPLSMTVPATQLLLDRIGQVKEGAGTLEIADRQYEAPLETIPPTLGAFPITINGVANTATQLKVISNLKAKNGIGQHQGTIDVDIDTLPAGHLTLAYSGTATVTGSTAAGLTITSKGTFKTTNVTGIFAGLVANGTYEMTIVESGSTFASPVTVSITTVAP
jgi:peptidoglycan hydrolase-like protein with peptidoglycan-binding domain